MINSDLKPVNSRVLIIDTKAGNLFSLKAAISRLGFDCTILQQPNEQTFDAIVVPGQGRFGTVMENLRANGWDVFLNKMRATSVPILGICVGMQIFFEGSEEDPEAIGFGWLVGKAQALNFPKKPMVGWAKLAGKRWSEEIVYFVNSYAVKQSEASIADTTYGENFCAAIQFDNITGVQFHPEKSSDAGSRIIHEVLTSEGVFA